jgi:hypothetical protein
VSERFRHAETEAEIAARFPVTRNPCPRLTDAGEPAAHVRRRAAASQRTLAALEGDAIAARTGRGFQKTLARGRLRYIDDLDHAAMRRRSVLGARLPGAARAEAAECGPGHPRWSPRWATPLASDSVSASDVAGDSASRDATGVTVAATPPVTETLRIHSAAPRGGSLPTLSGGSIPDHDAGSMRRGPS